MAATNRKSAHKPFIKPRDAIKKYIHNNSYTELVLYFFIAFCRGRAVVADISLSRLALVVTAAPEDIDKKAAAGAGAFLSLVLASLNSSLYVPYLIGIIIYLSALPVIKSERYTLAAGLVACAISKTVLGGIMGTVSPVYTALEAAFCYFLTATVKNGREVINKGIEKDTDLIFVFASQLTLVFSLTGADSRFIYAGGGAALALSWLWYEQGDYILSLTVFIGFIRGVMDKKAFALLFCAGLAVWLRGLICSSVNSLRMYPLCIGTAVIFNIAFLPELGGFALTATVIVALIVYKTLPYLLVPGRTRKNEVVYTGVKDYHRLENSMRKLEQSLSYLGNCAIDISKLNEKNLPKQQLEDMVAEDVCRKCSRSSHCWTEKYSFTAGQFSKYAKGMSWAQGPGFDMEFYSRCTQIEKLKTSFEENHRLLISRKYILQSQKNNGRLLQNAFMSISRAVGDMLYINNTGRQVNSAFTMQMDRFLDSIGVKCTYCLCSLQPDKATFGAIDPVENVALYKIKAKLESLYNKKFTGGDFEKQGKELIYSFYAVPKYNRQHSIKTESYKDVNGDCRQIFKVSGDFYVLLSDGMGTGSRRAAESRTVTAMAKSLLSCGVSLHSVMNIVNLALNLRSSGENGATLEILKIDLYTGKAVLAKAGGGVSLMFNEKGLTRYDKDSLPVGILKDAKYTVDEFVLTDKDTVVLMSDGVGNISSNIANLFDKSCESVAKFAMEGNSTVDDKTAIAVRLTVMD